MMNDKFDAKLRQHLLSSANERPADGQLSAVLDGVEATRQRHPLVARLTWTPGRIGPVPTAPIRYGLIAVALALAMVAGALLAGAGGPARTTVFEGTWTSIDSLDRSGQTLVVGPGMEPDVYFEDGYASGGACVDDELKRFTAHGTGTISGNHLETSFPDGGGCGLLLVDVRGSYDYDSRSDSLIDQDGLSWARPLRDASLQTRAPGTPETPSATTFTSAIHGISIAYPDRWQTRSATASWSGQELSFDSPEADVIFDPRFGDGLYLLLASEPFGALSADEWRSLTLDRLCSDSGGPAGSADVDGADAWAFGCGSVQNGILISTETRGYFLSLVASTAEPGLAETYDWPWLKRQLEKVDLRPDVTVSGPEPTAACIEFRAAGTYTAEAELGPASVDVPGTADQVWHGHPLHFMLRRAPCLFGGPSLESMAAYSVPADACNRGNDEVPNRVTYVESMEALLAQTGHTPIALTSTTVDGYPARFFTVTAPTPQEATCSGNVMLLFDGVELDPGESATVYIVDVDGQALPFVIRGADEGDVLSEFEAVIASLDVTPPD